MDSSATSGRRDSAFLVLAPDFSSGYPTETGSRSSSMSSNETTAPLEKLEKPAADSSAIDTSAAAEPSDITEKTRRSSSTSSARRRFLKLGPVHYGGDPLDSDFAEVQEK